MKSIPLVTIGIPTYNRAGSYLPKSLESALGQTYDNLEIIVSDNCSPDNTESVVRSYKDPRIRYQRHLTPLKPHENADYCVETANGKYFLLLHDDDLIDADFVALCVLAAEQNDLGFIQTGARTIDENDIIIKERRASPGVTGCMEFAEAAIEGNAVTYFCNTLYRLRCLREVGGFRSKTYSYQDVATNLRLAASYGRYGIAEPKASYRKFHSKKWGSSIGIINWCEDSIYLIHLMCELMPENRRHFMDHGLKRLCLENYRRAKRTISLPQRFWAYYAVYRSFKFRCPPWAGVLGRLKRRFLRFSFK